MAKIRGLRRFVGICWKKRSNILVLFEKEDLILDGMSLIMGAAISVVRFRILDVLYRIVSNECLSTSGNP